MVVGGFRSFHVLVTLAVTSRSQRLGERLKATTGRCRKAFLQRSEERSRL